MIFTSVNIGNATHKKVEEQLCLDKEYSKFSAIKDGAANYRESNDKMIDMIESKGTPEQRRQAEPYKDLYKGSMAAQGALGMIDSEMRSISRNLLYPSLKLHKPVPLKG